MEAEPVPETYSFITKLGDGQSPMQKITPVSHIQQPSESCSAEYFNLFFVWNLLIRSVLFSLYWVWLRCVLFILSPFHCLVHSQWVAFTMLVRT